MTLMSSCMAQQCSMSVGHALKAHAVRQVVKRGPCGRGSASVGAWARARALGRAAGRDARGEAWRTSARELTEPTHTAVISVARSSGCTIVRLEESRVVFENLTGKTCKRTHVTVRKQQWAW